MIPDPAPTRSRRPLRALLLVALLVGASTPATAQSVRVLLVGDSWSRFLWTNQSLRDTFATHGHPEILEAGAQTTINGSTAAEWVDPAMLQLITDQVAQHPDLEVVQITLGGNDFLDGAPDGWYVDIPDAEALWTEITGNIATVVDHVLALDPDLQVLLSLYDYVNFEDYTLFFGAAYCDDMFVAMGEPDTPTLNAVSLEISDRIHDLAIGRPRLSVRSYPGLMQYLFGFPDAVPPIPPGTILPPGDPSLPSPAGAMFTAGGLGTDCIHLSPDAYFGVTESLWWSYYQPLFFGIFADGFESGDLQAWD